MLTIHIYRLSPLSFTSKRSILSNIISRAGHELLSSSQSRWETKQNKAAKVSYFFIIRSYRIRSYFIRCLRLGCYWIQVYRFGCYRTWIWHIETPFECPSSISRRLSFPSSWQSCLLQLFHMGMNLGQIFCYMWGLCYWSSLPIYWIWL